ncbi:MAG TPA: DUF305 domain-containing protein [Candidatus Eisenbacteria bacterium]|nr:DUF305 domain-containing protein [Candidatus Eisenbacteria bacterium]
MALRPRRSIHWLAVVLSIVFGSAAAALSQDVSRPGPRTDRSRAPSRADVADEAPYLAENAAAMRKMMHDMAVSPTGDVDRDFVAMMVPHHQGAIDMAIAVLRYGHNEQLKRLAQEIIVTQQQEIAAMRLGVGESLPPSVPSPTQPSPDRWSRP